MFSICIERANFGSTGPKISINLVEFQANPEDPEKAMFMLVNPQELLLSFLLLKNSINKKKITL